MLIIAFILSLIFGGIGFIVTKNNAQYLLSGYNTMSEQERQFVDIDSYVKFFKRFHIILGLSLFGGVCLLSLIDNNWASIFMTVYPLVAYLYFLIKGTSFYHGSAQEKLGIYVIGGLAVVIAATIVAFSFTDYESSELTLNGQNLEIGGSFGISLNRQQVYKQELVDQLPPISIKTNGFAAGDYAKGSFKTKDGRAIRLYVNKKSSPYLLIKSDEGDIYYNHDEEDMQQISQKLAKWLEAEH